ncbi:hypothetical protein Ssi02_50260 [Sinosporangium siamense]|uniref:Uncharacterized protein n=1 Tax=Sinosporangium siamense TaxID=1367973 RepID=A0A919RJ36_9ACTN|nr:hypothetical protein Ssi02_50260 [Sinosporangium siamense]
MHEDLTAVVAGEEAETLVGVVPLDLATRHRGDLVQTVVKVNGCRLCPPKASSDRGIDRKLGIEANGTGHLHNKWPTHVFAIQFPPIAIPTIER